MIVQVSLQTGDAPGLALRLARAARRPEAIRAAVVALGADDSPDTSDVLASRAFTLDDGDPLVVVIDHDPAAA